MRTLDGLLKIESAEYRPCLIYGEREALFHRWVNDDSIIVKLNAPFQYDMREKLVRDVMKTNIYPHYADPVVVKRVIGLIEYRDGTIDVVEPKDIRFLDSNCEFENVEAAFEQERMNLK